MAKRSKKAEQEAAKVAVEAASTIDPDLQDPLSDAGRKTWFEPGPYDSKLQLRRNRRFTRKAVSMALRASQGLVGAAARRLHCSEKTVRKYLERFPDLKDELDEIRESYVDLAEASLLKQIQEKNTAATIFLLKCLGKKRGYIENPNVQLHAHLEAGSGSWVDIMKRVASASGGRIDPTPEEIARVIDVTPKVIQKEVPQLSASACITDDSADQDGDDTE